MAKAKQGKIMVVANENKKFGANEEYYAIWVDTNGKEHCLLFTEYELNKAKVRAEKNPEDIPKKGFFADLFD